MAMGSHVVVETPVRPAALLAHVLAHCAHPTTLVIASTSSDFVHSCVDSGALDAGIALQSTSLLQVAVARHIRVVFVPTVAHCRGFLAALDLAASRVAAPPAPVGTTPAVRGDRVLLVYDFLRLHRDTSEWSAQGLSASAAVLMEAGWRTGLDVLVVEGTAVFDERAPVLSTAPRRQLQRAGYPLRTERVRAVLKRWFTFRQCLSGVVEEAKDVADDNGKDEKAARTPPHIIDTEEHTRQNIGSQDDLVEVAKDSPPPPKTYVKDSEDDDDDLSDDEALYPVDDTA